MGSLLIWLHFAILPPLGWAIYHGTRTYTYTGMHKQMPLSTEQHQHAPHSAEYQIIPFGCSLLYQSVLYTLGMGWAHGLCKYIYILHSLNLIQDHSAISSHISMCMPLSARSTSTHVYACIHVSSWEERCCSFDVAAGDGHKRQAGWWKWSVWVNYSSCLQRASPGDTTHRSRVQGYE